MSTSTEHDRFARQLTRLFDAVGAAVVERVETREIWSVAPRGPEGLGTSIELSTGTLTVRLGAWAHTEALDPDDADERWAARESALDLLAVALHGCASVREDRTASGKVFRITVSFGPPGRLRPFATMRRLRWPPWGAVTTIERMNPWDPSSPIRLDALGRVPTAPWSGALQHDASDEPRARAIPLDGELDLHLFPPKDVAAVVEAYLDACLERGVLELRIVHGKGKGTLRRIVHAILERHPAVVSHRLGGMGEGSWGATLVTLRKASSPDEAS